MMATFALPSCVKLPLLNFVESSFTPFLGGSPELLDLKLAA